MRRRLAIATLTVAISPLLVGCDVVGDSTFGPSPSPHRTALPEPTGGYSRPQPTDPAAEGERQMREFEEQYREEAATPPEGACADVTSYDNNWDNDVLCTRTDGTQFYTSYDGADRFLAGN